MNKKELFEQVERYDGFEPDEGFAPMDKPFDPDKISLQIRQPTIDNIIKRLMAEPPEIRLDTSFQRHDGIWREENKSRLIESLLLKIPLPSFYFDGTDDDEWLIIDGLQRLSAIKVFVGDKALKLTKLEYLTQYEGYRFDELPRSMQRRIEETQLIAYIIQPGTPDEVKFNIFKRINTGGLPLSAQEIRHALFHGVAPEFLKKLAEMKVFKKVFTGNTSRMEDRELVLRFVSFYLFGYEKYEPDMDIFLNKGMEMVNHLSGQERDTVKQKFLLSMSRAEELFGQFTFRKRLGKKNEYKRGPLNKAIFDIWSSILADMGEDKYERLLKSKKTLLDDFSQMIENNKIFYESVTMGTGDRQKVFNRFELLKSFIERY